MANIRVTPETLNGQGADLLNLSNDLRELLSSIDKKVNEIIDGWDGLAQDGYFDMYGNMKESLDVMPDIVDALGNATIGAANAFSSVDEELKSTFSQG